MSYSPNSLEGGRLYRVPISGLIKGDSGSLDHGSYMPPKHVSPQGSESFNLDCSLAPRNY